MTHLSRRFAPTNGNGLDALDQNVASIQQGMYRYKQKHGHRRSFAQWRRAANKRESTSGLRNRSFFCPLFMTNATV